MPLIAATVTIGVFGLFHPQSAVVEPFGSARLKVRCAGAPERFLEGRQTATLAGQQCEVSGTGGVEADFVLSLPGRIRRQFHGTLAALPRGAELALVVRMPLEVAVASAVEAESPPGALRAYYEAQAIVSRSYYAAARRGHEGFDFCDTTHCQFVKSPPGAGSAASKAAAATAGRTLQYRGRTFAAYFAARCDDRLEPLPAARLGSEGEYPYFAARCDYCHAHPRREPLKDNARPHHHGLCQEGAAAMARSGADAAAILKKYFPEARF